MRRIFLLVAPVIVAILAFTGFSFILSLSASGKGALQVTSLPISNVYLNNKFIGKTPLCKCEGNDMLQSGDYTIRLVPISASNLIPYEQKITITKSILTVVDWTFGIGAGSSGSVINLTPLSDKSVELFVTSFPSGATITIDGNNSGQTPALIKSLTESDHEMTITKSGYQDKTIHIHTISGFQLNALITLAITSLNATASAQFVESPTPIPTSTTAKVLILSTPTGFLRVRSDPSLGASEEAQVNPGDTYPYLNSQDGWYEIQLSTGQSGWISSQYAQKE